jgi:hypothetical protein
MPVLVSDLVFYLTGKYLPYSPQLIEEEIEAFKSKNTKYVPIFEREICQGPFFDPEVESIRNTMKPEVYAQFLSLFQRFLNYYPDEKKLQA